jgi:hypothetical protein
MLKWSILSLKNSLANRRKSFTTVENKLSIEGSLEKILKGNEQRWREPIHKTYYENLTIIILLKGVLTIQR